MTELRKDDEIKVRLPAGLKAEAMKALKATTSDRRGALSALVRELLETWLLTHQKKSPAHRG